MLSFTRKTNSAALAFLVAGAVWFAVGALYGLFSAIHLVAPEFFNNLAALVFGRTRPVHVNTMLFGFIGTMLLGCALYYVPALLRTRLWSEPLAWVSFAFWNVAVLSGPVTFPFGITQGREYAEYVWIFDVSVVLAILALIVNLVMTTATRRENTLYVSVWYVFGAALWTAAVYPIGNVMWHPSTGAMPGLLDSIILWFYGHNVVGLFLTPLAIGAAYFVLPRVTQRPLYSHTLSLVGFWTLIALYSHIGGHHILQAPIPNWLKTITIVDSVAMIVPVYTVLANLWLTVRGRGGKLWDSPSGRFVMAGTLWYLVVCTQGPVQSLPSVQRITHFGNWVVGHAHIAVLGFSGFIALGTMWHVLPMVARRRVYSRRLVNLQFGLVLIGLLGFFAVLTTAGLIQGAAWDSGETVYRALPKIAPYMVLRALFGLFILTGAFVGLANLILTLRRGQRAETPANDECRMTNDAADAMTNDESSPNAGSRDASSHSAFVIRHSSFPMTPALLVIGSLLVFWCSVFIAVILPATTMVETPSEAWREWTPQEAAGHRLYVENGCSYCHSQFVRTIDSDLGAERIAERGDYVGYVPAILGTERTGPDLSQEAGEHPDEWHLAHFANPRTTRPLSLMPSWEFLGQDKILKLTAYVQSLGGKDGDRRVARQKHWSAPAAAAYKAGPDRNVAWLHGHAPAPWRAMPNPYPATDADLERGKRIYQQFCVNCHGVVGDGHGPAAQYIQNPPPLNFTTLRGRLWNGRYIGGIFYYQIMNGITGTAMPYFKRELTSELIWDVSNYVAVTFLGYTDAGTEPRGIPAAYEPTWRNPYPVPPQATPPGTGGSP